MLKFGKMTLMELCWRGFAAVDYPMISPLLLHTFCMSDSTQTVTPTSDGDSWPTTVRVRQYALEEVIFKFFPLFSGYVFLSF